MESPYLPYQDISYILPSNTFHMRIGAYPTQKQVDDMIKDGYNLFVDLTSEGEVETKYIIPNGIEYIYHSIPDRRVPPSMEEFMSLIENISRKKKIYVHCRGGHGRSGILGICYTVYIEYETSNKPIKDLCTETITKINNAHKTRKVMNEKWRKMGVPQTKRQKDFCFSFAIEVKNLYL